MAFLVDVNTNQYCFLYAHHSFGRLTYAVDTVLVHPLISKHHAIIEWLNESWFIRDISRNGSWLNGTQLVENTRYPLKLGDKIHFGDPEHGAFWMADLSPPADLLLPVDALYNSDLGNQAIYLDRYNLLPNEQQPQVVLAFDPNVQQWGLEDPNHYAGVFRVFKEHDTVEFAEQVWRLQLSHRENETELRVSSPSTSLQLNFIFDLSADEETTHLRLQIPHQSIELFARSHHYLTLTLARYRFVDAQQNLSLADQGWVYPEQLMKDLGMDISHLNIQIHRARKQFVDSTNQLFDAQTLIERKAGKVRFGGSMFQINKAQTLECQLPISGSNP